MNLHVHLMIGAASATGLSLIVPAMHIDDMPGLAYSMAMALTGSALPDIDINGQSKIKKTALTAIGWTVFIGAFIYKAGKIDSILGMFDLKVITGAAMLLVLTVIGLFSKHRTFTHQLIGLLLFSVAIYIIFGLIPMCFFSTGMLSHQLADMLNVQKIRYFFPLKKPQIALKVCKSTSFVAELIGFAATAATVLLIYTRYREIFTLPLKGISP